MGPVRKRLVVNHCFLLQSVFQFTFWEWYSVIQPMFHNKLHIEQIWMLVPGTSRLRNAPCGPTSNASTVAATTRATAIQTFCLWTTACRVFWDRGWTCLRTSKWTMTFGWSGKSSPSPYPGKSCCSENQNSYIKIYFLNKLFQYGVQKKPKWTPIGQTGKHCLDISFTVVHQLVISVVLQVNQNSDQMWWTFAFMKFSIIVMSVQKRTCILFVFRIPETIPTALTFVIKSMLNSICELELNSSLTGLCSVCLLTATVGQYMS